MLYCSERLLLRSPRPADWEAVLAAVGDEGIARNLASVPWPYDAAAAQAFCALPQDPRWPHFLLMSLSGGQLIGSAGLAPREGDVEVGYWLAREAWGQGYATEAVRMILGMARAIGHQRVVAGHFVDNPRSGRVLLRAGFLPTGESSERFSLARGAMVPSVEYVCNLGPPKPLPDAVA